MPIVIKASSSPKDLPKEIRDELRMTAALRCYSVMRSGNAKSLQMQYDTMSNLFHGDEPSVASNIKMLSNGSYLYKDLYDLEENTDAITSKSSQSTLASQVPKLSIKINLSRDKFRRYYADKDIIRTDLEKKSRNGKQLVSGRSLLEMAKKGTAYYRKALAFTHKKFDLDKMSVIESGNSIEDVIEYVRTEMYQVIFKEELAKKKTIVLDDDDIMIDDEDNDELENNYLDSLKKNKENLSSNATSKSSEPSDAPSTRPTVQKQCLEQKSPYDNENPDKKIENSHSINNTADQNTKQKKLVPKVSPPDNWFFPSWFSFVAYGPFVEKNNRLPLLEITDASKEVVKSRSQKRKGEKFEKAVKRASDDMADRGYSTDQKIQLKMIDLTTKQTNHRGRESILMGLCIQEQALTKQIDRAERMADRRALDAMDDLSNKWWKKVDDLIKEQEKVIDKIADINSKAMGTLAKGGEENQSSINDVTNNNSLLTSELSNTLLKASQVEVQSSFSKDDDSTLIQAQQSSNANTYSNTAQTTPVDSIITI